jgi:hypothetical protein
MKELIIDTNYLEQKYLNILVKKGYKTTKRILTIDNHKNGTNYLMKDFYISKDYLDNIFYYSHMINTEDFPTSIKDIEKYKKRYYDFKEAFDHIVNHDIVKECFVHDTNLSKKKQVNFDSDIILYANTITKKVIFLYRKSNPFFHTSFNLLRNRVEECSNFIYNGRVEEEELSYFIGSRLEEFTKIKAMKNKSYYMMYELEKYLNDNENDKDVIVWNK